MNQTTQTNHPAPDQQDTPILSEAAHLLRMPEVRALTGIKANSTVYDMIRRGKFPKPVKVGRMSYWSAAAVHRWIEAVLEAGAA